MIRGPRTTTWPIDWPQLVLELRAHGWPTSRVAEAIGRSHETVYRLAWGETREPPFGTGMDLLLLYRSVTWRDPPMMGGVDA